MLKTIVKKGSYHDSVVLMLLTNQISSIEGVKKVSIMLASGAGMNSADTAFLIQCGLFACCITTLIQSLGIRIGKFQIGARLPLVSAGSWTLITPMVLFANDPNIGIPGAFGAACLGTLLLFLLGPFPGLLGGPAIHLRGRGR